MTKSKKKTEADDPIAVVESEPAVLQAGVDDQQAAPEVNEVAAPKRRKAKPASTEPATLARVCEGYIAALERHGAGPGTVSSYGMELRLACRELGSDTLVADLTAERVAAYFESEAVMKTRSGKPKAPPTFLKTQRVLRQALVWAESEKLIERAPLPEPAPKA